MTISEEQRKRISMHLPDTFRAIIAEKTGYSQSMVSKVLHNGQPNAVVAEALIELAMKTKLEKEKEHKRLSRLAEQL
jgi:hypothetical protein